MKLLLITLLALSGCVGLQYPVEYTEHPNLSKAGYYLGLIGGVHRIWVNPHTTTPCVRRHEEAHAKERELGWASHSLAKPCERR